MLMSLVELVSRGAPPRQNPPDAICNLLPPDNYLSASFVFFRSDSVREKE